MNWTHTSTAAVAAKKSGAPNTAKIRKTVINVIVHIFLAILAFIWVLPIFWVILTSFRGEKGSYVSTFFPKTYTSVSYTHLDVYKRQSWRCSDTMECREPFKKAIFLWPSV